MHCLVEIPNKLNSFTERSHRIKSCFLSCFFSPKVQISYLPQKPTTERKHLLVTDTCYEKWLLLISDWPTMECAERGTSPRVIIQRSKSWLPELVVADSNFSTVDQLPHLPTTCWRCSLRENHVHSWSKRWEVKEDERSVSRQKKLI